MQQQQAPKSLTELYFFSEASRRLKESKNLDQSKNPVKLVTDLLNTNFNNVEQAFQAAIPNGQNVNGFNKIAKGKIAASMRRATAFKQQTDLVDRYQGIAEFYVDANANGTGPYCVRRLCDNAVFYMQEKEHFLEVVTETYPINDKVTVTAEYIVTKRLAEQGTDVSKGINIATSFINQEDDDYRKVAANEHGDGMSQPGKKEPIYRKIGPIFTVVEDYEIEADKVQGGATNAPLLIYDLTRINDPKDSVMVNAIPCLCLPDFNILDQYMRLVRSDVMNYDPKFLLTKPSKEKMRYIPYFNDGNINTDKANMVNIGEFKQFVEAVEDRIKNKIKNYRNRYRYLVYFYLQMLDILKHGNYYAKKATISTNTGNFTQNDINFEQLMGYVSNKIKTLEQEGKNKDAGITLNIAMRDEFDKVFRFVSAYCNNSKEKEIDLQYMLTNLPVIYQLKPNQVAEFLNYGTEQRDLLSSLVESDPSKEELTKVFENRDNIFNDSNYSIFTKNKFKNLLKVFMDVNRHYYNSAISYIRGVLNQRPNSNVYKALVSLGLFGDEVKAKELNSERALMAEASNNLEKVIMMVPNKIRNDFIRRKFDNKNVDFSSPSDSLYSSQSNSLENLYRAYASDVVRKMFELWNNLGTKLDELLDGTKKRNEDKQDDLYKSIKSNYATNVVEAMQSCINLAYNLKRNAYSKFRIIKNPEIIQALNKLLENFVTRLEKNNLIKSADDIASVLGVLQLNTDGMEYYEGSNSLIVEDGSLKSIATKIRKVFKILSEEKTAKKYKMTREKITTLKRAVLKIVFSEALISYLNKSFFANLLTCGGFNIKDGSTNKDRVKGFGEVKIDSEKMPTENFMELSKKYISRFFNSSSYGSDGNYLDLNFNDKKDSIRDGLKAMMKKIEAIRSFNLEPSDSSKLGDDDEKESKKKDEEEDEDEDEEEEKEKKEKEEKEEKEKKEKEEKEKKEKEEKEKEEKRKEDEKKALSASQNFEVSNMNTFKHNNVKISETIVNYKIENNILKFELSNFVKPAAHLGIFAFLIHDNKVDDSLKSDLKQIAENTFSGEIPVPAGAKDLALHFYLWDKAENPQKGAVYQYFISDVSIPDLKPTEELKKASKPVAIKFKDKDQKEIKIDSKDMGVYRLTDGRYVFWVSNYQKFGFAALQGIFGICMKEDGDFGGAGRYTLAEDKATKTLFIVIHEQIAKHFDSADHFTIHFYKNEQLSPNYVGLVEVNLKEKVEEENKDEKVKADNKEDKEKEDEKKEDEKDEEDEKKDDEDEDEDDDEKESKSKKKKKKSKKNKKSKKDEDEDEDEEENDEDDDKIASLLKDDESNKKSDDLFNDDLGDNDLDDDLGFDDDLF